MKVAIMQPYFMPYIGYFQMISAVDVFILYDNIKYTKKGWINRNRILQSGKDVKLTLPLKNDADYLDVCERKLSSAFHSENLLNKLEGAYRGAPYFNQTISLLAEIARYEDMNLFNYLYHSLIKTCKHLGLHTELKISSTIPIDHNLKSQEKVLSICSFMGASKYINPIGGMDLYSKNKFLDRGIALNFIQAKPLDYAQFGEAFVPCLSIIDVMMFNSIDTIKACILNNYELI